MSAPSRNVISLKPESLPLEGSRDTGDGIIISIYPDVCLTPVGGVMVAIPYTIFAYQSDDANTAATVRQTSLRSHTSASLITRCYGDEAGTGGGVVSGTHNSVCEPKTWSPTVRFEGHGAVRHQDEWWMNKRNTIGKLTYIKDQKHYKPVQLALLKTPSDAPAPVSDAPTSTPLSSEPSPGVGGVLEKLGLAVLLGQMGAGAGKMAGSYYLGQDGAVAHQIGEYENAQLPGAFSPQSYAVYNILGMPGLSEAAQIARANDLLSLKAGHLVDFRTEDPAELAELLDRPWPSAQRINANAELLEQAKAKTSGAVRTSGEERKPCPCIVGTYKEIQKKCAEADCDGEAHHDVPDYTLRYGTREEGMRGKKRIAGMPSFNDGAAVCLQGGAGDKGSAHWEAHGADGAIAKLGEGVATPGTAPIGDIISVATAQTEIAMGDDEACKELLRAQVAKSFDGVNRNALGRTTLQPPEPGTPAYYALGGKATINPR